MTTQPWLHELEIAVHGNLTFLSAADGTLGAPATGLFVDDRRVLHLLTLTCDGIAPTRVASHSRGAKTQLFGVARDLGDRGPDPTVEVVRTRQLTDAGLVEDIEVQSRAGAGVTSTLRLEVAGDGADISEVKGGLAPACSLTPVIDGDVIEWADDRHRTRVQLSGATPVVEGDRAHFEWPLDLAAGESATWRLELTVTRTAASLFDASPGGDRLSWDDVVVRATDRRLDLTVDQSLADLTELVLADPAAPTDVFAAAGTPWYLTLFGRDALWTARLALPFGTTLAEGTLRTLARRQGQTSDPATAEEPGKILHEVRRTSFADPGGVFHLPPVYYGTVDATPLWIGLLHEAWKWGLPSSSVVALRAHLDAALDWVRRATLDDGLLRYVDDSGVGLANQGWKDSGDSMRRRDGSIAEAPIALVETQAYAVAAFLGAAELYEQVFAESGASLRASASDLAAQVRSRFWVSDDDGSYLAMALDGRGDPVDGVGSNMGHVLGTGTLTPAESVLVAARVTSPDLLGGYGVGTLGRSNPAFNPIGYHTGSVWTHDTAIIALGLSADGHSDAAGRVVRGLVDAATHFGYRLPELYGDAPAFGLPAPYPASCRPQAWSAASAAALVTVCLGLRPDVPARHLVLNPLRPSPFGALQVSGLRIAGEPVSISLDADGNVVALDAPDGLTIDVR